MTYQFRSSIQTSNCIAFGCSHTWGVGVEPYETWTHLVNAKNYGVPGASINLISRIAKHIIDEEHPDTIFILWPDWSRFEYILNNQYCQSLPTDSNRINFVETHTDEWCRANFANEVELMHAVCKKRSIQLVDMTLYDLIPFIDHADRWPLSKLGHHYGPKWHQQVAELLLWAKITDYQFPIAYD